MLLGLPLVEIIVQTAPPRHATLRQQATCRQQHQMAGIKYWLSEMYLLESEPVELVKAA